MAPLPTPPPRLPTASLDIRWTLLLLLPPQLLPGGASHESAWPRFPADERLPDTPRGCDDPAASRGLRGAFHPDPAAAPPDGNGWPGRRECTCLSSAACKLASADSK